MTPLEALEKAVELLEGQTAVARICGEPIKQGHVWNWLNRDKKVPAEYVMKIRCACLDKKGVDIPAEYFRPDVFGEPARKTA